MVDHIERELVLPAPPEEVWHVVTGPGWLADEVRLDLTPGGEAYFRSADRERAGWVEEAVAPGDADQRGARLIFWWSADGNPATRVELTLDPEDDDLTRVRVVESRPLEVLDVMGIPLPGSGGQSHEPTMLIAA
jgi:uncharacterized protein YndB with AHSA1/START domain